MTSKVVVIIATGEKKKARTGIVYAKNACAHNWLDEVKIVFFGPAETLIVEDEELSRLARETARECECLACKAISDKEGISNQIEELGVNVEYVGSITSNLIKDGYVPMVW